MNITTRKFEPKYKNQVFELYKKSFGKEMPERVWNWRFEQYPFEKPLLQCAFFNQQLIALYQAQPIILQINQKFTTALFSLNTMTDPEFSGRGIMTTLANEVYRIGIKNNYKIVFGFANKNSRFLFPKKLGFKEIKIMPEIILDIPDNLKLKTKCKILPITVFDESYSSYYKTSFKKIPKISIYRTSSYLNWRYIQHPEIKYQCQKILKNGEFAGYYVLKNYEGKKCHIIDFLINDDIEVFQSMIEHAITFCNKNNIPQLTLWVNRTLSLYNFLTKIGFREKPMENYFVVKLLSRENEFFSAENYDEWYITMGDSDVF